MRKISVLILVCLSLSVTYSQDLDPKCMPNGIKLSLGDNIDLSSQYDKDKLLKAPRHDYTITYFTKENCPKNYCEVYSTFNKSQKYTINPVAINRFFQAKDTSGISGTQTRTNDFERYVYEYQLDAKTLNFAPDSIIQYSCFYPSDQQDQTQMIEKGVYEFYHPDYSKLSDREVKFAWVADYDVNANEEAKYAGRKFGKDNMKIMDRYIKQDRKNYVAIIAGGDYAYDLQDDSGLRGAEFLKAGEFTYSTIPYVTVAGNHEEWYNFDYYKSFFRNPRHSITQSDYYTLSFGQLLMVGLNTNKFIKDQSNKFVDIDRPYYNGLLKWFDDTMYELRGKYRWIIVYSHQNIHCFEDYPTSACYKNPTLFSELEDLLLKHKVDVYLAGHVHAYERVHPNYKGEAKFQETDQCQMNKCSVYKSPSAPVYVVDGTGGTNHYFPRDSGYPGGKLTVATDRSLGFSTFSVKNSTHLVFEHILSDQNFKVFDSFTIYKPQTQIIDDKDQKETPVSNSDSEHTVMYIVFFVILGAVVIANVILFCWFRRRLMQSHMYTKSNRRLSDVESANNSINQ